MENEMDLLKFAMENGMLDKDAILRKMEMKERERLLSLNPYAPYLDKEGRWCVYLPEEGRKAKRVLKRRKTKKEIEDLIIAFWKKMDENPTINDLFEEWLSDRLRREEISKTTGDRYRRQYDQCFEEFGLRKVSQITEYDVEKFAKDVIHEKKLTVKGFGNFRTLCYGIFYLAKQKHYVDFGIYSVFKEMKIAKNAFRTEYKEEEDDVFTEEEAPIIVKWLEEHVDLKNLGLLLTFKSGVRVGELAALKKIDVKGCTIHVCRTEIRYDDEEDPSKGVYEVRDRPKTKAGIRNVILPDSAIPILRKIEQMSSKGEWLFEEREERLKTYQFRARLRHVCEKTGIKPKSPHKIRKQYATELLDGGVPESIIIGQMGHTDILTTKNHYYRNRKNEDAKRQIINQAIGNN